MSIGVYFSIYKQFHFTLDTYMLLSVNQLMNISVCSAHYVSHSIIRL